jgi:hypothetical protein
LRQDRSINFQIVEGAEGISEFGDDWDDLFIRAMGASPFLSRSWIRTFVEEGRLPGTPFFVLAWFGTKLVALFPLAVRKVLNTKTAVPIGTDEGAYLGLLIDPEHRSAIKGIADFIISGNIFDMYYSADLSSEDTATNDLLDHLVSR